MTLKAHAAAHDTASDDAAVPTTPTTDALDERAPLPAGNAPVEIGGRDGPEPTRYGDWEMRGRCIDF
jgi:hypothetical protein